MGEVVEGGLLAEPIGGGRRQSIEHRIISVQETPCIISSAIGRSIRLLSNGQRLQ
jgi:hypothetical protein